MSDPLVSIIVNCFNSERFLKEAIDSIYQQDYFNWEIIFWDNASTDGSSEVAKSYDNRLKYFLASITTSLGEARNLALKKASGKYVAFLDCDDKYLPGKISKQVTTMESSDAALCYGSVFVINENGEVINRNKIIDKHGYLLDKLLLRYEINMQTVMIRRAVLSDNHLSFDLSLEFSPDYDLFMRIASEYKLSALSDFLVEYRKADNSLTSRMLDRIAPEMEYTLNGLYKTLSKLNKENKNLDKAIQMLNYYKSLPLIQEGKYREARKYIYKSIRVRKRYFVYFILMFFPVKNTWILKKMLG
jgi:glycosyltransferase involved in cell wall biosynthesis